MLRKSVHTIPPAKRDKLLLVSAKYFERRKSRRVLVGFSDGVSGSFWSEGEGSLVNSGVYRREMEMKIDQTSFAISDTVQIGPSSKFLVWR